jgi:predicted DNA-binding antitoxin AbrB/MazE fold protein
MTQHVTAIFDAGVLKPLGPLTLQDQEVVSLVVKTVESKPSSAAGDSDKTLFDVLNEAGWIGSIKDGPTDMSTNPKYMEGFGKDGVLAAD